MATTTTTTTMRAWLYSRVVNGIENSLTYTTTAARPPWPPTKSPSGGSNQVLVQVHYASLNPVDYKVAELGLAARAMVSVPASPGLDFSGVVAALPPSPSAAVSGDGSSNSSQDGFQVGDRVFGRLEPARFGALGEYVVADYEGLAKVPDGNGGNSSNSSSSSSSSSVSLEHAACVGTAAATALQAIEPHVSEGKGDRVFVNGGSGGTGTYGIQIAKALGCYVVASCSTGNVGLCESLGADLVIDYKQTPDVSRALRELAAKDGLFSLVVDNVGSSPKDLYKAADDYLDPKGTFVQVGGGFSVADLRSTLSRVLVPGFLGGGRRAYAFLMVKNAHKDFVRLAGWMGEGKVKAVVDEVFDDAPEAFRKLKTGRTKGKIVVRITKET